MNRKDYFEKENYLNFQTGYPERPVMWFEKFILPNLQNYITNDKKKLLDVGCASGYFTNILDRFISADGCDFAENRVNQAKQQFPHINFYQIDLTSDNFTLPTKYDIFFTNAVIPHIPLDKKVKVFENIASIANPNATFVLYDQLIENGVVDGFVGLFSVQWLKNNISQWKVTSVRNICIGTDEIVLKLNV